MTISKTLAGGALAILFAVASIIGGESRNEAKSAASARIAIAQALPQMKGDTLSVKLVEVAYAPGESSAAHSHPCPVIGYVISGALKFQVRGEPERVYKAGDTFYEAPNGVHQISANASQTEPAKFLAYFVCDHDTPLTVPPPGAKQ